MSVLKEIGSAVASGAGPDDQGSQVEIYCALLELTFMHIVINLLCSTPAFSDLQLVCILVEGLNAWSCPLPGLHILRESLHGRLWQSPRLEKTLM